VSFLSVGRGGPEIAVELQDRRDPMVHGFGADLQATSHHLVRALYAQLQQNLDFAWRQIPTSFEWSSMSLSGQWQPSMPKGKSRWQDRSKGTADVAPMSMSQRAS
jgi:hypothetical protein